MPVWSKRYRAGEHRAVWDELHAIDQIAALAPSDRDEIAEVAALTIERALQNFRTIAERLASSGYVFETFLAEFGGTGYGIVTGVNPKNTVTEAALTSAFGNVPPTLRALVASGIHLWFRGSFETDDEDGDADWGNSLLDPVEFGPMIYEADGGEPAHFLIAGDYLHKNDISGADATELRFPADGADIYVLENTGHAEPDKPIWLVDYLRLYSAGGGFRVSGAQAKRPKNERLELREGLLDF